MELHNTVNNMHVATCNILIFENDYNVFFHKTCLFLNRITAGSYATDATIDANVFFSYQNNQGPMLQNFFVRSS
jgi:hypothetical protein